MGRLARAARCSAPLLLQPQVIVFAAARHVGATRAARVARARRVRGRRRLGRRRVAAAEAASPTASATARSPRRGCARRPISPARRAHFALLLVNECALAARARSRAAQPRRARLRGRRAGCRGAALVRALARYGALRLRALERELAGARRARGRARAGRHRALRLARAAASAPSTPCATILDAHFALSQRGAGARRRSTCWSGPRRCTRPRSARRRARTARPSTARSPRFVAHTRVPLVFGAYDADGERRVQRRGVPRARERRASVELRHLSQGVRCSR